MFVQALDGSKPNGDARKITSETARDVSMATRTIPPYWMPYLPQLHAIVGNPEKDKQRLTATSPALHAEKIKTPLLIAQGANDPRVKKAESDQMVEALKARGVDVHYMVKDGEGHGFRSEENPKDRAPSAL